MYLRRRRKVFLFIVRVYYYHSLSNNTTQRRYVCMHLAINGSIRYLQSVVGWMNCMCCEYFVVVIFVQVQVSYGDRCWGHDAAAAAYLPTYLPTYLLRITDSSTMKFHSDWLGGMIPSDAFVRSFVRSFVRVIVIVLLLSLSLYLYCCRIPTGL